MGTWRVLIRTTELVTLACDGAVLLIEEARVGVVDPELRAAIGRFAPHLAFNAPIRRGAIIEREATSEDQRVVVGQLARGATSFAYMVTSREPVDVGDVVASHMPDLRAPFDHFAD